MPTEDEFLVIARNPQEMATAQAGLIKWVDDKIYDCNQELAEFQQNLLVARRERWKDSGLVTAVRLGKRRCEFYEKVKAALEAGYVIVPNFPIDVFAIRTNRDGPSDWREHSYHSDAARDESSNTPALSEGRYVSVTPLVKARKYTDVEGKPQVRYWADAFQDADFPFKFAKLQVLEDTSRAMALKIFDEIGVLPAQRKVDPMVIGQIIFRKGQYHNEWRRLSFLITWWLGAEHLKV